MEKGSGREGGKGCSAEYIVSKTSQNNRATRHVLDTRLTAHVSETGRHNTQKY